MRNRLELLAKCVCGILALLLVVQLPGMFTGGIALSDLKIPKPPEPKPAENTNSPPVAPGPSMPPGMPPGIPPGMPMPSMPGMPMQMGGMPGMPGRPGRGIALAPDVQAKVNFIVEAELLGPVQRPLPMALLGIAGDDVILRAPNGQVGLVTVGNELGGVKLLQIGTNRILIEHEGQKKELTLFSGYGSETLLSNEKETSK